MFKVKKLNYQIGATMVVKNFDFCLKKGEIKTLFGPSGCGKTTLLRLFAGLLEPKSGSITRIKSAFVFQTHSLFENLTALQNVQAVSQKSQQECLELLQRFGFSRNECFKFANELSGGMRARVSFARALAYEAEILLLDEPFSGLDFATRQRLLEALTRQIKRGKSAVLVTHDAYEAARLSGEVCFLSKTLTQITQCLKLDTPLDERDEACVERILKQHFQGRVCDE